MKVKLLDENAIAPTRASNGAAGFDLYSAETVTLWPRERSLIATGVAVSIPDGMAGMIWPRSGLASRHGLDVMAGLIDSDYRGEVKVMLINHGSHDVTLNKGDRIAQLVCQPVCVSAVVVVDDLDETERGNGGFGSTGV